MKKILLGTLSLALVICVGPALLRAQEDEGPSYRGSMQENRERIKAMHGDVKDDLRASHEEEVQLREQIKAAREAGDEEKVRELKDKLRSAHKENMSEHHEKMKQLKDARKEMKAEIKEKRSDYKDENKERQKYMKEHKGSTSEHKSWKKEHKAGALQQHGEHKGSHKSGKK